MGEICSICSKIFKNKRAVTTHKATVHSEKKHACNVCEKKFKKKDQLNTHLSTHQDPIDICYQCGITFTHKTNLAKHRKTYHLPQNHKCKIKNPTTRYWLLLKEYENWRKSNLSLFAKTKRGPYKKRKTNNTVKKVTFRWKKK